MSRAYPATEERNNSGASTSCAPWVIEELEKVPTGSCDCRMSPLEPQPPTLPPLSNDKKDSCCERLLEILKGMPGGDQIRPHKPKQSVKVKVANLCRTVPTKDAVLPVLILLLKRFKAKTEPVNDFERSVQTFLKGLGTAPMAALEHGIDVYDSIPKATRESIFETRFETCDHPGTLDPLFILKVFLQQAKQVHRSVAQSSDPGAAYSSGPGRLSSPGKVRLWERIFPGGVDQKSQRVSAPWPWICAVNPGADNRSWYRNRDFVVPGSRRIEDVQFDKNLEFGKVCEEISDPNNVSTPTFSCDFEQPPSDSGLICDCHSQKLPSAASPETRTLASRYNYLLQQRLICLALPKAIPGQSVALRGMNFFSRNCKVRLRALDGSVPEQLLGCTVVGDTETPDQGGQSVATCEVHDGIEFTLPAKVNKQSTDVVLPPGIYSVEVIVPNDVAFAPLAGQAPREFVSNSVWLDVQTSPDVAFRVFTDEAFCHEETDGPGSDEPWFRAFVTRFDPGALSTGVQPPLQMSVVDIMNTDDVDSGEPITFSAPDLFNGRFPVGGACAIAIFGLEIDDNDEAKRKMQGFGDAYARFWVEVWNSAWSQIGRTGYETVKELVKDGILSTGMMLGGLAAMAALAIIGIFYAAWAPADPIAFEVMLFDAQMLWDRTDPTKPVPPEQTSWYPGRLTCVVTGRVPKLVQSGGGKAMYAEDHSYFSIKENSHYRLVYKVERL